MARRKKKGVEDIVAALKKVDKKLAKIKKELGEFNELVVETIADIKSAGKEALGSEKAEMLAKRIGETFKEVRKQSSQVLGAIVERDFRSAAKAITETLKAMNKETKTKSTAKKTTKKTTSAKKSSKTAGTKSASKKAPCKTKGSKTKKATNKSGSKSKTKKK